MQNTILSLLHNFTHIQALLLLDDQSSLAQTPLTGHSYFITAISLASLCNQCKPHKMFRILRDQHSEAEVTRFHARPSWKI